jgi:nucleosome binding factor SPN SPT16 subunit
MDKPLPDIIDYKTTVSRALQGIEVEGRTYTVINGLYLSNATRPKDFIEILPGYGLNYESPETMLLNNECRVAFEIGVETQRNVSTEETQRAAEAELSIVCQEIINRVTNMKFTGLIVRVKSVDLALVLADKVTGAQALIKAEMS